MTDDDDAEVCVVTIAGDTAAEQEEQEFLASLTGMSQEEIDAVTFSWPLDPEEEENVAADVKPWEPVRQIVRAPDGRMWLLDAVAGRVERGITLDEIRGWASYDAKPPVTIGGVLTFMPPDEYTGPRWEMHNKTWAQMQRLARCTCVGTKPLVEHYAGCCLVTVSAGLFPGSGAPA